MISKTIKFVDYNGNTHEDKFYFNLNKAELLRLEMNLKGGIEKTLKRALAEGDNATLFNLFEQIVLKAYGKKTIDGGFAKNEAVTNEFAQSEAYSEFVMELFTDPTGAKFAEFFKGVIPQDMAAKLPENLAELSVENI